MKMSSSIFWGIILILIGLSLILKVVFHVDFPFFKFLFAFFLIYLGIRIFIGKDFRLFSDAGDEQTVIFSQRTITRVESGKEYNVIFGNGIYDLRNFEYSQDEEVSIKMNTVFGNSEVLIGDSIPLEIKWRLFSMIFRLQSIRLRGTPPVIRSPRNAWAEISM